MGLDVIFIQAIDIRSSAMLKCKKVALLSQHILYFEGSNQAIIMSMTGPGKTAIVYTQQYQTLHTF